MQCTGIKSRVRLRFQAPLTRIQTTSETRFQKQGGEAFWTTPCFSTKDTMNRNIVFFFLKGLNLWKLLPVSARFTCRDSCNFNRCPPPRQEGSLPPLQVLVNTVAARWLLRGLGTNYCSLKKGFCRWGISSVGEKKALPSTPEILNFGKIPSVGCVSCCRTPSEASSVA